MSGDLPVCLLLSVHVVRPPVVILLWEIWYQVWKIWYLSFDKSRHYKDE